MNAYAIAEKFRAAFAADSAFTGTHCLNDQTSAVDFRRPAVIFVCETRAMNASGSVLTFTLTAWVEGSADKASANAPDPAAAHAAQVALVKAKLLTTGKAALLTALNTGGYDFKGWGAIDSDPGLETHHFRTPVAIGGTVKV